MNPQKITNSLKYLVVYSEEDKEYVAKCKEFPSFSSVEPTPERALSGLKELISEILEDGNLPTSNTSYGEWAMKEVDFITNYV